MDLRPLTILNLMQMALEKICAKTNGWCKNNWIKAIKSNKIFLAFISDSFDRAPDARALAAVSKHCRYSR